MDDKLGGEKFRIFPAEKSSLGLYGSLSVFTGMHQHGKIDWGVGKELCERKFQIFSLRSRSIEYYLRG